MKRRCAGKGLVVGLISGIAAGWVMNQFFGLEDLLQKQKAGSAAEREQTEKQEENRAEDNPTVTLAEVIARNVFHQQIPQGDKKLAGDVVHYGYSAVMGGIYGAMAEFVPATTLGFGTAYAAGLWLFGDELSLWLLGLSKPPSEYPLSSHLSGLGAHLVYGASTEALRRILRKVL